jgi:class 3 adenylate cyclase
MSAPRRPSFPLALKVDLIIIVSLVVGIGSGIAFLAVRQYTSAIASTDDALRRQAQIIYYSIKNLMLPGDAPVARQFLGDMQQNASLNTAISLYRRTGAEAFVDNETIKVVNGNNAPRGGKIFTPRPEPTAAPDRVGPDETNFWDAVRKEVVTVFQETDKGRVTRTLDTPLPNNPPCAQCHGADHSVRGILEITVDITGLLRQPRDSALLATGIFVLLATVLSLLLTQFLRRAVIIPVQRIGEVCTAVASGVFDHKVLPGPDDEIGELGRTVNGMVDGLFERFQLSKFVSASTIRSIGGSAEGRQEKVTVLFSDVRGFTKYSEGQKPETVVRYLNSILNAQTEIVQANGGDIDKYVGDEVMAIFTGPEREAAACRTALAIQKELSRNRETLYGGLGVGIGIDSGSVIMGMIGSEKRADFTVIGDRVNTASRMCAAASTGTVLISEATFAAVKDQVTARGPYALRVKGKAAPLRVRILTGVSS